MATNANENNKTKVVTPEQQNKVPFAITESYKNIRTNIISVLSKIDGQVLAISSPNASEGKSTTSVNIAITLAQLNKKVLIIDADSRRPTVHKKMKVENTIGCMDILTGEAKLEDAVQHYNSSLDVITTGTKVKNPSELFSSEEFANLLLELKDVYDYIIIDTPPINPVSDALVIAQKCDATILIVRAGVTTYQEFGRANESLKVLDIKLHGVIINGSEIRPHYYYKKQRKYYRY